VASAEDSSRYSLLSANPTFVLFLKLAGVRQKKNGPLEHDAVCLVITLAWREPDGVCTLLLEEKSDASLKGRLVAAGLTLREAEVLLWVMRGETDSEIGVILGSKTKTISKHLEHIY